jgi:hypothetical protein
VKIKYNEVDDYREFISASNQFPTSTLQFRNDGYDLLAQLSVPLENYNINNSTIDQYTNILFNTKTCPQYTGLLLHQHQMNDVKVAENKINEKIPNIKEMKTKFMNENRDFLLEKYEKIRKTTSTSTRSRIISTSKLVNKLLAYPKQPQTREKIESIKLNNIFFTKLSSISRY